MRQTPTSEERLILLLCGSAPRRAEIAPDIAALAERVDYGLLAALMERQLLLPLLGTRLLGAAPAAVPSTFSRYHQEVQEQARWRGLALEALDRRLRTDLAAAGIEALPLKGATLSRALYGEPGTRLSQDVDLLVHPAQLEEAATVLQRHGYRPPHRSGLQRDLHLELEHPKLPPVELHWRVHWYEDAFSPRMLRRSVSGESGLRAQPADELASLLLFFSRDGLVGLRLAADAAAWWDCHGDAQATPLLDPVVAAAPELLRALSAAALALEDLVGIPSAALLSQPSKIAPHPHRHAARQLDRDRRARPGQRQRDPGRLAAGPRRRGPGVRPPRPPANARSDRCDVWPSIRRQMASGLLANRPRPQAPAALRDRAVAGARGAPGLDADTRLRRPGYGEDELGGRHGRVTQSCICTTSRLCQGNESSAWVELRPTSGR